MAAQRRREALPEAARRAGTLPAVVPAVLVLPAVRLCHHLRPHLPLVRAPSKVHGSI